jgi:hypothetical protein
MSEPKSKTSYVRTALLVLAVAAACYVSHGFGRLWAEWREAKQTVADVPVTEADVNSMSAIMPLAGQWSFAELDFGFRSTTIPASEATARLDAMTTSVRVDANAELPDVSEDFVELAESLHIRPVERDGNQIYILDRPELKARLVVRPMAGRTKMVALAAAYPQGDDRWQLLECTPSAPVAQIDNTKAPHLLPLPEGAERNGGRFADDGRMLLELVTLRSSADALLSSWKNAGWEVRPSGLGNPDTFSYLCVRGNDVIYAWSADPRDDIENLMLVRTPNAADTRP